MTYEVALVMTYDMLSDNVCVREPQKTLIDNVHISTQFRHSISIHSRGPKLSRVP